MSRSRVNMLSLAVLAALAGGAVFVGGCGVGGEEKGIIRNFFTASRVGDRTTLGNISMVSFDPAEQGTVSTFSVESVSELVTRSLRTVELSQAVMEAQANQEEFAVRMRAYQDENIEVITRVLEAERNNEDVRRGDQEVQEAWAQWRSESQEFTRAVSQSENDLAEESQVASVSAFDPNNPVDVRSMEGELLLKEVTVTATVELDEVSSEQQMVITLQKTILGSGEETIEGRWILTGIS